MRLITWNCHHGDALDRAEDLADFDADVVVLQECARPGSGHAGDVVWFGENPRHGAAVIARPPYRVAPVDPIPAAGESVFPVRIDGPHPFHLLAVWAKPRPSYVASVCAGLDAYGDWLRAARAVVAGDFNSHPRWDSGERRNHTHLVTRLRDELGLVSAWHVASARLAGAVGVPAEEPATHFHQWRPERGFHFDYVFVPTVWAESIVARVPEETAGSRASDHRPLIVDLAFART